MIKYEVIVYSNGCTEWYLDDEWHREDGPAIYGPETDTEWRLNGKLHRIDGPAVMRVGGSNKWYLNGIQMTEEEHLKTTTKAYRVGKVVEIDGVKYELKKVEG